MPKISIITPAYADISQKVNWLEEMIQSVISQTLVDWELIIIDDKSPLPIPLQNAYVDEPRVRWFQNAENFGPAMTRNTAVALAESDCILPLDSDDLLAHNEVLEHMYDAWIMDKSKIIYGSLQQYTVNINNQFERGKVYNLGEYTFERVMHLGGLIPVTAMHSRECWEKAGGWKKVYKEGLEDVEYWLMAGKQGCCGQKINTTTLLYRRHETSRAHELKHGNQEKGIMPSYREMQLKIKDMHNDVYEGRFPVSCCGKNSTSAQAQVAMVESASIANRVTELKGYDEKDKVWVEYKGPKKASFRVLARGMNLPSEYMILGNGHKFQAHKRHENLFRQRSRQGFVVGVQDPRNLVQEEKVKQIEIQEPSIVEVPRPELSTIMRPDERAARSKSFDVKPAKASLNDLNLSPTIEKALAGYTVESLASESLSNLIKLQGIGEIRASQIIKKAKELINAT